MNQSLPSALEMRPSRPCAPALGGLLLLLAMGVAAAAQTPGLPAYTNLAGNAIQGIPVALTATDVTLDTNGPGEPGGTETLPLSIFSVAERRRLAADFGTPRLPTDIARAVDGARQAIRRAEKRADKGLCAREEAEAFIANTRAGLVAFLDRAVEEGRLSSAERDVLPLP